MHEEVVGGVVEECQVRDLEASDVLFPNGGEGEVSVAWCSRAAMVRKVDYKHSVTNLRMIRLLL